MAKGNGSNNSTKRGQGSRPNNLITNFHELLQAALEKQRTESSHEQTAAENVVLKEKVAKLERELKQTKKNMDDNNEYLEGLANDKIKEAEAIHKATSQLERALKEEKDHRLMDHVRALDLLKKKSTAYEQKIKKLEKELETVSKFSDVRSNLMKELEVAKQKVQVLESEQRTGIAGFQKRLMVERTKLKAVMERRIEEMELQRERLIELELSATTKRTIDENARLKDELVYQGKQIEMLMDSVKSFREQMMRLRTSIQIKDNQIEQLTKEKTKYRYLYESQVVDAKERKDSTTAVEVERINHKRNLLVIPPNPQRTKSAASPRKATLTRKAKRESHRARFFP